MYLATGREGISLALETVLGFHVLIPFFHEKTVSLLKLHKSLIRMCPLRYNVFTCRYIGLELGEGGEENKGI